MLIKTIKFVDYNGVERTEEFCFNLTRSELVKLEFGETGGLSNKIQRIIQAKNVPELMKIFDELVDLSYGEKSADGREFNKSPELTRKFKQTDAYDRLFMEMFTVDNAAAEFFQALVPSTEGLSTVTRA